MKFIFILTMFLFSFISVYSQPVSPDESNFGLQPLMKMYSGSVVYGVLDTNWVDLKKRTQILNK